MNTKGWSFDEYCTYVLSCVAGADKKITFKERKVIKIFLKDKHIGCIDSFVDELLIVIKYQTQEECVEVIKKGFEEFVITRQEKKIFIELVEEIILSDLEIDTSEMEVYRVIKKLIRAVD